MDYEKEITEPVKFSPLKHHLGFIKSYISEIQYKDIPAFFDSVNHNYIDIYTGCHTPSAIAKEILQKLLKLDVFEKSKFSNWISASRNYRKIKISDGSDWVVRIGLDDKRYIHIHPAKTGAFTMRFKGPTLKTIYSLILNLNSIEVIPDLKTVNNARVLIGLSPIKKLEKKKGILKCWNYFSRYMKIM